MHFCPGDGDSEKSPVPPYSVTMEPRWNRVGVLRMKGWAQQHGRGVGIGREPQ